MSMIRKDMERVRLFQNVRIICAAATISTCKPQISQNCEIASIYQPEKPQWQNKDGGSQRRYLGENSQITATAVWEKGRNVKCVLTNFGRGSSFAHLLCSFGRFVILTATLAHSLSSKTNQYTSSIGDDDYRVPIITIKIMMMMMMIERPN